MKNFFKKLKKIKGGSQKIFFKNRQPQNKKMGKNLKKNNFQKNFFKKILQWERDFGFKGAGILFIIYSN